MLDPLFTGVELLKSAENDSFLWLKLKHVMQGCPELYLGACSMPSQKWYKNHDLKTPYACLQDDFLQLQGTGADVLVCEDMNAQTAELDDFVKFSELPKCLDIPAEADDLPAQIST